MFKGGWGTENGDWQLLINSSGGIFLRNYAQAAGKFHGVKECKVSHKACPTESFRRGAKGHKGFKEQPGTRPLTSRRFLLNIQEGDELSVAI